LALHPIRRPLAFRSLPRRARSALERPFAEAVVRLSQLLVALPLVYPDRPREVWPLERVAISLSHGDDL
jgi:hypothetical protein